MSILHLTRRYVDYQRRSDVFKIFHSTNSPLSTSPGQKIVEEKFESVKIKLYDFMKWYEQLTGIDEIRVAQNKVIEAQDRFAAAQEKRREITLELNDVKNKIKDLQEELSTTSRGEERYIVLITKEHKLLKDEVRLTDKFNLYEREERELFTTLTSAVKDSHEKERIQANKTKYLSIIGSIIGALIGIAGSTLNNRSKIVELKKMVLQSTENGKKELEIVCKQLETTAKSLAPVKIDDSINQKLQEITEALKTLNPSPLKTEDSVNQKLHEITEVLKTLNPNSLNTDDSVNQKLHEITEVLRTLHPNPLKNDLQLSLARIEKNLNSLVQHLLNISPIEEPSELPNDNSTFTIMKNDISYIVISCFSLYFLYRLISS